MKKILLHGCCGRMGRVISDLVSKEQDIEITAGVDSVGGIDFDYPVFGTLQEVMQNSVSFDVIVDFSVAACAENLIDFCVQNKAPLVFCTTGIDEKAEEKLRKAAQSIPVLRSANMSLGVNVLIKVLSEISPVLAKAGFDIEVVEKHHRMKKDAPSGTALALADAVNSGLESPYEPVFDRSQRMSERPKNEIGISAVRGGSIPGDHDVIFAGEDEVVTISHRAYSRAIFGKGAIAAAKFLVSKEPGMYSMADVLA
ncbi:MAG: 4-hydroxy-tetrahydrodipicolinate reductase [Lachnospiraceae bacterium]|nr:4-hydroxy-tetrahydrodipicolinate reductase [Lachnospiraceae bacterium]